MANTTCKNKQMENAMTKGYIAPNVEENACRVGKYPTQKKNQRNGW